MKKITLSVLLAFLLAASATACATPDAPSRGTMEDTKQPSNNGADVTTASDDTKTEIESNNETETNPSLIEDETEWSSSNPADFDFEIGYEPLTEPVTRGGEVKIVMSIKNNSGEDFVVREDYCTDTIYTLKTVTPRRRVPRA